MTNEIKPEQVKRLVDILGPHIGRRPLLDFTQDPYYPETRRDVCVVRRTAQDGYSYGFDTLYLFWTKTGKDLNHREIDNSKLTKDYLYINDIREDERDIIVKYGGNEYRASKEDLGIED